MDNHALYCTCAGLIFKTYCSGQTGCSPLLQWICQKGDFHWGISYIYIKWYGSSLVWFQSMSSRAKCQIFEICTEHTVYFTSLFPSWTTDGSSRRILIVQIFVQNLKKKKNLKCEYCNYNKEKKSCVRRFPLLSKYIVSLFFSFFWTVPETFFVPSKFWKNSIIFTQRVYRGGNEGV